MVNLQTFEGDFSQVGGLYIGSMKLFNFPPPGFPQRSGFSLFARVVLYRFLASVCLGILRLYVWVSLYV